MALSSARCCSAWQRLVFLPYPQISLAELEPCTELIKRSNLSPAPYLQNKTNRQSEGGVTEKPRKEKNRAKRQGGTAVPLYYFFVFMCLCFFGRVVALWHKAFRSLMCTNLRFNVYKFAVNVHFIFQCTSFIIKSEIQWRCYD